MKTSVQMFERAYAHLVLKILNDGEVRKTRNGETRALFGQHFKVDMSDSDCFPLLTGRKMYYKGVLGELAAFLRGPKHLKDFEQFGCNYWKNWANDDGSLRIDYGNAWFDYNGYNQFQTLIDTLKTNPMDRRLLISSWRPDRLNSLSLPCCHHTYQWYVRDGKYLDMLWMQRSVDTMIGLPSDIILAAAMNILIANEVGLEPGELTFSLGDTHIYAEHYEQARTYAFEVLSTAIPRPPKYNLLVLPGGATTDFVPEELEVIDYNPLAPIKFELKA